MPKSKEFVDTSDSESGGDAEVQCCIFVIMITIYIRGRPIQTSGTSEPIETSVNWFHHGTDADVVKKVFVR